MVLLPIFLSALLMFAIIYFAVRLSIESLLLQYNKISPEEEDFGLVKLRDIEVISNVELEEVIELFNKKIVKKERYLEYQKYANVLSELKESGYFTDDDYLNRMNKLQKYYKVHNVTGD
jgi:hypothetical protein